MFIEELRMRCLIPAVLFLGFTGLVFGQHGGGGGVGGGARGGGGGGRGYSRGFANPGRVPHPTHGIAGVVPYPVFYGGYYDGSYDGSGSYGTILPLPDTRRVTVLDITALDMLTMVRKPMAPECHRW